MDLDRMLRVPWWAWPRVWWGRVLNDRAERLMAAMNRAAHERWLHEPQYKMTLTGGTQYDNGSVTRTHAWELFETPNGKRSLNSVNGDDHILYHTHVKPWLHGFYDFNYDKTAEAQRKGTGELWGAWKKRTNAN